nr:hypothetical protein [uncultured Flavobacterium sp.]
MEHSTINPKDYTSGELLVLKIEKLTEEFCKQEKILPKNIQIVYARKDIYLKHKKERIAVFKINNKYVSLETEIPTKA